MPAKSQINLFHLRCWQLRCGLTASDKLGRLEAMAVNLIINHSFFDLLSRIGTDIFSSFFLTGKQNYWFIFSHPFCFLSAFLSTSIKINSSVLSNKYIQNSTSLPAITLIGESPGPYLHPLVLTTATLAYFYWCFSYCSFYKEIFSGMAQETASGP